MMGTKRPRDVERDEEDTPSFGREYKRPHSRILSKFEGIWRGFVGGGESLDKELDAENNPPVPSSCGESNGVVKRIANEGEIEICGMPMPSIPQRDPESELPYFTNLPDLVSPDMGVRTIFCTDEYFGQSSHLFARGEPSGVGDCWQTRRRRRVGHEWILIYSQEPMLIHGIGIDSRGTNSPAPQISIECCELESLAEDCNRILKDQWKNEFETEDNLRTTYNTNPYPAKIQTDLEKILKVGSDIWDEMLPITRLKPNSTNYFLIQPNCDQWPKIHLLKINLLPDGGLGRLRIYGERYLSQSTAISLTIGNKWLNYASACMGAWPTWSSGNLTDTFPLVFTDNFESWSTPAQPFRNPVVLPSSSSDGTKPKFTPGPKVIISFPHRCRVHEVRISTKGIKGDVPYGVEAAILNTKRLTRCSILEQMHFFRNVHIPTLSWHPLGALNDINEDDEQILPLDHEPVLATHLALSIIPDGRINNVQVWGQALNSAEEIEISERQPQVSKNKRRNSTQLLMSSLAEAFN